MTNDFNLNILNLIKKLIIFLILSLFLISCSTTKDVDSTMIENDKDYEEIVLKFPKGTGVKERYIVKKDQKLYESVDKLPFKRGVILDPITMEPANGITKSYHTNVLYIKKQNY